MSQNNLTLTIVVIAILLAVTTVVLFQSSLISFTTIDAPNGTDPEATLGDTLVLTDGDGITITGSASADSITIEVNLATATSSVTGSATGLEFIGSALGLISGCTEGQVLKWINNNWSCADDN